MLNYRKNCKGANGLSKKYENTSIIKLVMNRETSLIRTLNRLENSSLNRGVFLLGELILTEIVGLLTKSASLGVPLLGKLNFNYMN